MRAALKDNPRSINLSGKSLPKTNSRFMIVQENDKTQLYEHVGSSLLSYTNLKIKDWKLVNETKTINSLNCKKAELSYKGREWIAWYTTEISMPYGSYKFGGLLGLIVKITDKNGDYDFELIKSMSSFQLKRKTITINKKHYENSKLVTKLELENAKENFRKNIAHSMVNDGVILSQEQIASIREKQKKDEVEKKGYNPIELED